MKTKNTNFFRALKLFIVCLFVCISYNTFSQQQNYLLLQKLDSLRDTYVNEIKSMGFTFNLTPPTIVLDNPRSFGNYENGKNILHTCDWNTLPTEVHQLFEDFAAHLNAGLTGEQFFDVSVHQWIFIHELGHWWRACQQVTAAPYENEKADNRVAAAYWNERDPKFYQLMVKFFEGVVAHMPNPVPAGEEKAAYLNKHYQELPGGSTYTWYQSVMNIEVSKEMPFSTFKRVVKNAGDR